MICIRYRIVSGKNERDSVAAISCLCRRIHHDICLYKNKNKKKHEFNLDFKSDAN